VNTSLLFINTIDSGGCHWVVYFVHPLFFSSFFQTRDYRAGITEWVIAFPVPPEKECFVVATFSHQSFG